LKDSHTLFELNEYIKRVVALNFPEPIWITCELSQVKYSRGHVYLDLVEQDELGDVIAQSSAVIWGKTAAFLRIKLKELFDAVLQEGSQISIKVRVEFSERYGLKLIVEDLDPSYTIGKLELERRKILERLIKDGLIDLNQRVQTPKVYQRIAIISSETAAGLADFRRQLNDNAFGYAFELDLYHAAMQGQNTAPEICSALDKIKHGSKRYNVVAIIRGGGSKLDLASFDDYNIGAKIAKMPVPVLTGIGHEIDQTVADVVAFKRCITPTAVAEYIIQHNFQFESELANLFLHVKDISQRLIKDYSNALKLLIQDIIWAPKQRIQNAQRNLDLNFQKTHAASSNYLLRKNSQLNEAKLTIAAFSPDRILKRGFALIQNNDGKYLTSVDEAKENLLVKIKFKDGELKATLQKSSI